MHGHVDSVTEIDFVFDYFTSIDRDVRAAYDGVGVFCYNYDTAIWRVKVFPCPVIKGRGLDIQFGPLAYRLMHSF